MLQSLPLPSRIKENIPIEWRHLWKLWFLIIVIQHVPRISGWTDKHFRWRIIHFLPPRLCYDLYDLIIFIVSIRLIIADHSFCAVILYYLTLYNQRSIEKFIKVSLHNTIAKYICIVFLCYVNQCLACTPSQGKDMDQKTLQLLHDINR